MIHRRTARQPARMPHTVTDGSKRTVPPRSATVGGRGRGPFCSCARSRSRVGANQQNLGTPLSLRIGLLEWLEARVSADGFLHQSDAISSVGGLGNVQAGAKLRLFADPGGIPVLSLRSRSGRVRRVHLTLPTGLRIRRAHASHLGPALSAQLVDKTRSRAQSADVARELPSQNPSSDAESIAVRVRIDLNHDPLD